MAWAAYRVAEARGAVVMELERELASRGKVFPDRVAKGRMTDREAEYQIAIWREILGNVSQGLGAASWWLDGHRFAWSDKVKALERELDYRRRLYPDWVAKGRLDQATADHRIELVEMVRDLYWRHMFGWRAPAGPAAEYEAFIQSDRWTGQDQDAWMERRRTHPGRQAFQEAVEAHVTRVDAEEAGTTQQELAL